MLNACIVLLILLNDKKKMIFLAYLLLLLATNINCFRSPYTVNRYETVKKHQVLISVLQVAVLVSERFVLY